MSAVKKIYTISENQKARCVKEWSKMAEDVINVDWCNLDGVAVAHITGSKAAILSIFYEYNKYNKSENVISSGDLGGGIWYLRYKFNGFAV